MLLSASLFNQLLQHFPRHDFAGQFKKHKAKRGSKGFLMLDAVRSMLFRQLTHADSLREISNDLACCTGKLVERNLNLHHKCHLVQFFYRRVFHFELFWTAAFLHLKNR